MDFSLTTEQALLRDSVTRFVQAQYGFDQRRALAAGPGWSRHHWTSFAELGWLGAGLPEDQGGLGGSALETMIVQQEFGKGLILEPFLPVVVAAEAIRATATPEQQAELLAPLVEGRLIAVLAHDEPGQRNDLSRMTTRALPLPGGGWRLEGHKIAVLGAPQADLLLVCARRADTGGLGLYRLSAAAPGLMRLDHRLIDHTRAAELHLDGVEVESGALLGAAPDLAAALEAVLDRAAMAAVAEAVGIMDVAIGITRDYLKTRRQFGRPIGEFQVLQHRMADMYIELEQARSALYAGTAALDSADTGHRRRAVSQAKAQAGKAMQFVGEQAIQLHGGIGMTEEYQIGHCYKRLLVLEGLFGNTAWHVRRFARLT